MMNLIKKFSKKESGATAIEYGLIAALIAVAVITGAGLVGTEVDNTFDTVGNALQGAQTTTTTSQ